MKNDLYLLQEDFYKKIYSKEFELLKTAKLCGGTALARCYLNHRVSHDLDIFIAENFKPEIFEDFLKELGVNFYPPQKEYVKNGYSQWHGTIKYNSQLLKVSFIADMYYKLYPSISMPFGTINIQTEPIEGLYHRKLRTIAGNVNESIIPVGARQSAKDLYDIFILSKKIQPLNLFLESLDFDFPLEAFYNGLSMIDPINLQKEMQEIAPQLDVFEIMGYLYDNIGMIEVNVPSNDME